MRFLKITMALPPVQPLTMAKLGVRCWWPITGKRDSAEDPVKAWLGGGFSRPSYIEATASLEGYCDGAKKS
jgi:hypothetical protein